MDIIQEEKDAYMGYRLKYNKHYDICLVKSHLKQ